MSADRAPTWRSLTCAIARRTIHRVRANGLASTALDAVAVEEPLSITIDGDPLAVTMRTPGDDHRLALGLLFAEGIIDSADDVITAAHCGRTGEPGRGNVLEITLAPHCAPPERRLANRRWLTSAACGVCGRAAIDDLLQRCAPVESADRVAPAHVRTCVERLAGLQPIFRRTGGLHAAAAFGADGDVLAAHEDVGRHNAVDKVVGALLLEHRDPLARRASLLAVSGRAGFEIIQKAARAAIPIVASVSAPSSLAVDLAERCGITLAGFTRADGFNVYSHAWRIGAGDAAAHPTPPSSTAAARGDRAE